MKFYPRNENAMNDSAQDKFHFLKPGKTVLRVLPPFSAEGSWFKKIKRYYFAFGDTRVQLNSPMDHGLVDPIWNYGKALYETADERLMGFAERIRPSRRYVVNALVLADSKGTNVKNGVQPVLLPEKVKEELCKLDRDTVTGYGDITNVEKGFNVVIERTGEGKTGTKYSVQPFRESSDIRQTCKDQGVDFDSMDLHNLDLLVEPATEAQLNEALQRFIVMNALPPVSGQANVTLPVVPFVLDNTGTAVIAGSVNPFGTIVSDVVAVPEIPPPTRTNT